MNQHERKLIQTYLRAETDIINEIARLRSLGLADYHAAAALRRVRRILSWMQSEAWTYTPKAIEEYFYANRPELRIMPTTLISSAWSIKGINTTCAINKLSNAQIP